MNKTKLWSVVALSTTVIGIPSVGRAATPKPTSPTPNKALSGDAANPQNSQSTAANLGSRAVEVTEIYSHNLAGRQVTTLYVRNIPFLTFAQSDDNTVLKVSVLAAKINQLIADKVDPNQISVSWKSDLPLAAALRYRYVIRVNSEELVEIDSNTRLPDTTNNVSQDALQATNRLRRLIGGTIPLRPISSIPGQPQQPVKQPEQTAKKPQQNSTAQVRATSKGMASYYSYEGSMRTATGERFNPQALTAAHRSLPFGTKVRVTNTNNGRSVVVRINDRGPFIRGRVIDVSLGAARELGMISSGVASVKIEVLDN